MTEGTGGAPRGLFKPSIDSLTLAVLASMLGGTVVVGSTSKSPFQMILTLYVPMFDNGAKLSCARFLPPSSYLNLMLVSSLS